MSGAFGIYLHWPFCLSKCPYCDFNSYAVDEIDQETWRDALLTELRSFAERTGERVVTSIFFGGGSPSLMAPATTAALIDAIAARWSVAGDVEITLEANPGTVDADRFAAFREAGVTRLSLGVQALDDDALRFLGRRHDLAQAVRALELARAIFPRLSFDLIYARPGQTLDDWREELALALALASDHLSLYQLSIEANTPLASALDRGAFSMPDEETAAALFELTQAQCAAAGFPAYEVSNHARPGSECRGNLLYWEGGDYVGVGPGAHGRISTTEAGEDGDFVQVLAFNQHAEPGFWLKAVTQRGHGTAEETPLSASERIEELVMMGLRLTEGIAADRFFCQTGRALEQAVNRSALETMRREGLLEWTGGHLRTTSRGRLVLNSVTAALLSENTGR